MKSGIQCLKRRSIGLSLSASIWVFLLLGISASALAQAPCPSTFKLRGSDVVKPWSKVTNNAWQKMLTGQWIDKGFHFYSQVRERGPKSGVPTPSELESEIMKKVKDEREGTLNRRQILLPILNNKGKNLRVIYDYDGSKCMLVTFSY